MAELKASPGWKRVEYHEWIDRKRMGEILGEASVGIVTFHPIANRARPPAASSEYEPFPS